MGVSSLIYCRFEALAKVFDTLCVTAQSGCAFTHRALKRRRQRLGRKFRIQVSLWGLAVLQRLIDNHPVTVIPHSVTPREKLDLLSSRIVGLEPSERRSLASVDPPWVFQVRRRTLVPQGP